MRGVGLPSSTNGSRRARLGRRAPGVLALLCAAAGVVDLASAIRRPGPGRLQSLVETVPGALSSAAVASTVCLGLLLLMLARGLRRRKRRAWVAAVGLLSLSVVLQPVRGSDIEGVVLAGVLLLLLLLFGGQFHASGDPRTRWRAGAALVFLVGADLLLGLFLVRIRGDAGGPESMSSQVSHVLLGLVGVTGPLRFVHEHDADLVSTVLGGLGILTGAVSAYLFLRPAEPRPELTSDDDDRLRRLLALHGCRDSLGYFALRRDKSVLWSPTGKAAVSYRVLSGVALVSGDPVGDPEAWPGAIERFLALAADHAWVPAVMGCSERGGTAWARTGLRVLELGDEAVVDADAFTLNGRAMRGVRQAVNRVERAGYTTTIARTRELTDSARTELLREAAAWRGSKTERGFSMALGRLAEEGDEECVIVQAHHDGHLRGFLHFVPWGSEGLSLDVMRRDRGADNGVNELLIAGLLRAAPGLGVHRVSLNFAMFRSTFARGESLGAGPMVRRWRAALQLASRWFQLESLYKFNAKFAPQWVPRYVCYPQARDLPRISLAALEAEAFLVWPRVPRLRAADTAAPVPRITLTAGQSR